MTHIETLYELIQVIADCVYTGLDIVSRESLNVGKDLNDDIKVVAYLR